MLQKKMNYVTLRIRKSLKDFYLVILENKRLKEYVKSLKEKFNKSAAWIYMYSSTYLWELIIRELAAMIQTCSRLTRCNLTQLFPFLSPRDANDVISHSFQSIPGAKLNC